MKWLPEKHRDSVTFLAWAVVLALLLSLILVGALLAAAYMADGFCCMLLLPQ